jgi:hypothetical protein
MYSHLETKTFLEMDKNNAKQNCTSGIQLNLGAQQNA